MAVLAPFPNFLIIGMQRNATRWLRFNLNEHPEICAPPLHLEFFGDFDYMVRRGLRWYREQFVEWDGEPFLGEASSSYLMWFNQPDQVALRIQKLMPDVRLIAIVGDPVERLHSALRHHIRWGRVPPDITVANFLDLGVERVAELQLFGGFVQAASLELYREVFGDQLQILFREDVAEHPERVYRQALEHIGASPDFVAPHLDRVLYSDAYAVDFPELTDDQRANLYEFCRQDIEKLEELTGRDLSSWNPANRTASVGGRP